MMLERKKKEKDEPHNYRPINIQTREKNRPINKYNKKEVNLLIIRFSYIL
jgi:hypothetical protein